MLTAEHEAAEVRRTVLVTLVFAGYSNCSGGTRRAKVMRPFKPEETETIKRKSTRAVAIPPMR